MTPEDRDRWVRVVAEALRIGEPLARVAVDALADAGAFAEAGQAVTFGHEYWRALALRAEAENAGLRAALEDIVKLADGLNPRRDAGIRDRARAALAPSGEREWVKHPIRGVPAAPSGERER